MGLIRQLPDPWSRFKALLQQEEYEDLYIAIFGDPVEIRNAQELAASYSDDGSEEADEEQDEKTSSSADDAPPYNLVGMGESLLMSVVEELRSLRSEHASKGGKKRPKKIKTLTRPVTAQARILGRHESREADEFARSLGFEV